MAPQRHCQSVLTKTEKNQIHRKERQTFNTTLPCHSSLKKREERKNEIKTLHHLLQKQHKDAYKAGTIESRRTPHSISLSLSNQLLVAAFEKKTKTWNTC